MVCGCGLAEAFDLPAFAVVGFEVGVDGVVVGGLGFGVPVDPLFGGLFGEGAGEDDFAEVGGVFEVGGGGAIGEDGVDPVVVVVLFGEVAWVFFVGEVFFWEDVGALCVGFEDGAVFADPEAALEWEFGEFFGHGDFAGVGVMGAV